MAKRKPVQARSIQRPFVCEEPGCHRCFTRFDHLQRHALVHDEGAVKLPCPDCGKTFLRHDMLVRHQRSVHEPNNKGKRQSASRMAEEHGPTKKSKSVPPQASSSTSSLSSFDPSSSSLQIAPLTGMSPGQGSSAMRPVLDHSSATPWRETNSHKSSEDVSPASEKSWSSSILSQNGSQFLWSSASAPPSATFPMLNHGRTAQPQQPSALLGSTQFVMPPAPTSSSSAMQGDVNNRLPPYLGSLPNFGMPRDSVPFHPTTALHSRGSATFSEGFFDPSLGEVDIGSGSVSSASSIFAHQAYKMMPPTFGPRPPSSSVGGDNPAHVGFTSGTPTVPTQLSRLVIPDLGWSGNWHPAGQSGDAVQQSTTNSSSMSMGSSYGVGISPFTPVVPSSTAEASFSGLLQPSNVVLPQHAWLFDRAEESPRGSDTGQNGTVGGIHGLGAIPPEIVGGEAGSWVPLASAEPKFTLDETFVQPQGEPEPAQDGSQGLDEGGSETKVQAWFITHLPSVQGNPHFEVCDATRERLLDFLRAVPNLLNSTIFSSNHLAIFLSLFFDKWNRIVPMLHEGTFYPGEVSPALLAACVVMGSYFAEPVAAADLGQKIAAKLWAAIVSLDIFDPQTITLEILQALVLLDAYGTFCADRRSHEMADCFHPMIVTIARRNAIFDSKAPPDLDEEASVDIEGAWRQWVSHEEKIRIAHTIFMLDIQHATLFRHKPSLAALQRTLSLPAETAEWEQETAQGWRECRRSRRAQQPQSALKLESNGEMVEEPIPAKRSDERLRFGAALKMCFTEGLASTAAAAVITPEPSPSPGTSGLEDPFIRLLMFLGLTGLAYDLNHHSGFLFDQTSSSSGLLTLKQKVCEAMKTWTLKDQDLVLADPGSALAISMHIAGKLTIHADIITIQVACDVNPVLGQYVSAATLAGSRAAVGEWAWKPEARLAVLTALQGLSLLFQDVDPSLATGSIPAPAFGIDDALLRNRVAYLCCMVLFAFTRAHRPAGERLTLMGSEAAQAAVSFFREVSSWTEQTFDVGEVHKYLGCILQIVEHRLAAARWELSREASATLRRLLTQS